MYPVVFTAIFHVYVVILKHILQLFLDVYGHAADYDRYKAPVLDMVRNWFAEHGNPPSDRGEGQELPREVRELRRSSK